ncbi:hypothetical protein AgCh_028705 [Apium graveolens]
MPNLEFTQNEVSEACQKAKMKRSSHKSKTVNSIKPTLESLMCQVVGGGDTKAGDVTFDDDKCPGLECLDESEAEALKFKVLNIDSDSEDEAEINTYNIMNEVSNEKVNHENRNSSQTPEFDSTKSGGEREESSASHANGEKMTRSATANEFLHACFFSQIKPKKTEEALLDPDWISAMQEELNQFKRNKVWKLVPAPKNRSIIVTKWMFKNKMDGCKRFQANPKESHLMAVTRIFRYLKGTGFEAVGYIDADFAGCRVDRKSTSGSYQFLGQRLVSWYSKKQQFMSTSTPEAEYITTGSCCAQVLWINNLLMDYGLVLHKIPIMCDNTSAISIVASPVNHSKIKHIDVRYHFIREHATNGTIELIFVPTEK